MSEASDRLARGGDLYGYSVDAIARAVKGDDLAALEAWEMYAEVPAPLIGSAMALILGLINECRGYDGLPPVAW